MTRLAPSQGMAKGTGAGQVRESSGGGGGECPGGGDPSAITLGDPEGTPGLGEADLSLDQVEKEICRERALWLQAEGGPPTPSGEGEDPDV